MLMRTTTLGTQTTMMNYIASGQSRYYELSEESASGKKLTKPSDDPSGAKNVINANTRLNQLSNYTDNMKLAQNELDVLDDTLSSLTNSVQNGIDLSTQAANGSYSTKDLSNIKIQIDQITQNIVDLANTQYNGNYIFSGTSTSTPAYTVTKDASGNITNITYNGTPSTGEYQRYVTISDGISVTVNTTGDQIFGDYTSTSSTSSAATGTVGTTTTFGVDGAGNTTITTATTVLNGGTGQYDTTTTVGTARGLLGNLMTVSASLAAGNQAQISTTLDKLSNNLDTMTVARTKFAAVTQRFEITQSSIDTSTTQLKSYRSDLQDADLAEVLTDLSAQELALQATQQVTTKLLNQTSLLDYIR